MSQVTELAFLGGLTCMGQLIASLFFLRFWSRTRDGLFAAFAGAFLLMALNTGLVTALAVPREDQSPFFLLRLAAYLLIIAAILGKNVRRS